jgi:hypothetical protein
MSERAVASLHDSVRHAVVSGAAKRQRAYRSRQAQGVIVLKIPVDEVAITEFLIECGWLRRCEAEDLSRVEAALAAHLRDVVTPRDA